MCHLEHGKFGVPDCLNKKGADAYARVSAGRKDAVNTNNVAPTQIVRFTIIIIIS